jgi:hypothetical protein
MSDVYDNFNGRRDRDGVSLVYGTKYTASEITFFNRYGD